MQQTLLTAALLCSLGCEPEATSVGEDIATSSPESDAVRVQDVLDAGPEPCALGEIELSPGVCVEVGLAACAEIFEDPLDGRCDPRPEDCSPGQLIVAETGCEPVGIPTCHPSLFDEELGLCDPSPQRCPDGTIPVPTQGCVSLSPAAGCGSGVWGNIEPLLGDVHVNPTYLGGDSNGTRDRPHAFISHALGQVKAGKRIVLAAGWYSEPVLLTKSVELAGVCSESTRLKGSPGAALKVEGNVDVTVRDLTISSFGANGALISKGARVSMERVRVVNNGIVNLRAVGAGTRVTVTESIVGRTQALPNAVKCIGLEDEAEVIIARSLILGAVSNSCVSVGDAGSVVSVTDSVVTDCGFGGVMVHSGASADLDRVAIASVTGSGLSNFQGGEVTVTDSIIREIEPHITLHPMTGQVLGYTAALSVEASSLVLDGVAFADLAGVALSVASSASLTASELLFTRITALPQTSDVGYVAMLRGASTATFERCSIRDHVGVGLWADGVNTRLEYRDGIISGTRRGPVGAPAHGVVISGGAEAVVERAILADGEGNGLVVFGAGSAAQLEGSRVARLATAWPTSWGAYASGALMAQSQGTLSVKRTAVDDVAGVALLVTSSGLLDLEDTSVVGVTSTGDADGDALQAYKAESLSLTGVEVTGAQRAGVLLRHTSASVAWSVVHHNALGVVTLLESIYDADEASVIADNDVDQMTDGSLPIHDEPMDLPPLPSLHSSP